MVINITFEEITDHLMHDVAPSVYFNSWDNELEIYPLNMLAKLKQVEQSKNITPKEMCGFIP